MSTQLEINNIIASSGNFTSSLQVNGTGVSINGHTHTSSQISDSTTAGRALLTGADASAQRTSLGLGTLATQNGTFSGTSSGTNTGDQTISISGDVTAAGGTGALTATVTKINGVALSGLSTGLLKNTTGTGAPSIAVAGTDYAAASHTHTASQISDSTTAGRALLTGADASAQRTSLGLGTLATQSGTFSGTSSGTNTGDQTISIGGDVTAAGSTGALTATVTKINGVSLAGLSTGLLKNTTSTGAPTIAVAGTDYAVSVTAGSGISVSSTAGAYTINAKVYSTTIGDGSATSYTVTHNLSVSNDIQVTVRDTGTNYYVYPDIKYVTNNSVLIEFVSAPTSNQYRVSVIGF